MCLKKKADEYIKYRIIIILKKKFKFELYKRSYCVITVWHINSFKSIEGKSIRIKVYLQDC